MPSRWPMANGTSIASSFALKHVPVYQLFITLLHLWQPTARGHRAPSHSRARAHSRRCPQKGAGRRAAQTPRAAASSQHSRCQAAAAPQSCARSCARAAARAAGRCAVRYSEVTRERLEGAIGQNDAAAQTRRRRAREREIEREYSCGRAARSPAASAPSIRCCVARSGRAARAQNICAGQAAVGLQLCRRTGGRAGRLLIVREDGLSDDLGRARQRRLHVRHARGRLPFAWLGAQQQPAAQMVDAVARARGDHERRPIEVEVAVQRGAGPAWQLGREEAAAARRLCSKAAAAAARRMWRKAAAAAHEWILRLTLSRRSFGWTRSTLLSTSAAG